MVLDLLKPIFVLPIIIASYLFAFLVVCVVFIGIALVCAAPFVLIIGLVLWIFF
jgi:hypothetical protein